MDEKPIEEKQPVKSLYGTTVEHCQEMIHRSLTHCPMVKFLRESLAKAGCPVGNKFFLAQECDLAAAGGFIEDKGIVVCSNHLILQSEVDQTLIHELIHAYDQCRAANLEWSNCAHHACSEIRASNLSGDCHYKRELLRGHYDLRQRHQICVRRRAVMSVAVNPNCSQTMAEDAVDAVWHTCYKDTQPFDRIP